MNFFQKKRYLFENESIVKNLLTKRELILFLDYDGTLAAITETPDAAIMTAEMRKSLVSLTKNSNCHLAIISGRMLSELKEMVDIPNITYVGNHGFEIEDPNSLNFKGFITLQYKETLLNIKRNLIAKLSPIRGIWIEDKGIILTIHYRSATEGAAKLARKIFMNVCQNYLTKRHISIMEGKKILEIRPPIKWDKGEAALWIISKQQHQYGKENIDMMYVGDDVTDEDAFKMLDGIAVTVKVGIPQQTSAKYYLKNQPEVMVLLNQILALKN